jgi:hypothetical protein
MKFLKTLAAIDTEVAFRGIQTLYRTKNFEPYACRERLATCAQALEAHDNRRFWVLWRPEIVMTSEVELSKRDRDFLKLH